ncbi:unnamed protein product [Leptosia nina]|uniref:Uncharacterized protein n=1 Tax=Leptosia nina TaxID=320188 RepID=A0AAV1JNN6_9NEOP
MLFTTPRFVYIANSLFSMQMIHLSPFFPVFLQDEDSDLGLTYGVRMDIQKPSWEETNPNKEIDKRIVTAIFSNITSVRSIEVWLKSGRLHSEVLEEQKLSEGQLRRPGSTIILWLKCEQMLFGMTMSVSVPITRPRVELPAEVDLKKESRFVKDWILESYFFRPASIR